MKYADIVVDNNTDATDLCYTYACSQDNLLVGMHVKVPFGMHNRQTDGYVVRVFEDAPAGVKRIKEIAEIDPEIVLTEEAVRTALWMHNRYLCRYIEALKCFLPVSEVKRKTKDPFADLDLSEEDQTPKKLTQEQSAVLEEIQESLSSRTHRVFLLKGVTGSGKTEVYLQAMQKVLDVGRQGIVLVPEISLTPQLVARFMSRFGRDSVAVLHSKLTPAQRATEYKRISEGRVRLAIGARSAVFAPFDRIGLIILDESHESSYKSDKSPKYDTCEVAVKRAMNSGAAVILGSATPSVVDYYRSEKGIFKRIEIKNRYNRVELPDVKIVDMTAEIRAGNRSLFSRELAEAIQQSLDRGKQIILFLNRRGYLGYIFCRECGYAVKCPECGISMPYHKDEGLCECHYCGRKQSLPRICPECGSKLIGGFGAGTQQVEEKVAELFPDAKAERLDLDSVRKKGELEAVLKRFQNGKTDILIGTQIVAKGLDFKNVGLVGIISADVTLNIPDFRSAERSFQLVTQAAGRSGRGEEKGSVIIQTYSPDHAALLFAANHDYESFYREEIRVRKAAAYPPFTDIFQLVIHDSDEDKAYNYAEGCARWLRGKMAGECAVLGPAQPMLKKQGGLFRSQILIKAPAGSRSEVSALIREMKEIHEKNKNAAQLITVDINPFTFI